jgi:transcriptional regulator with XRE-family HTH domain
MLCIKHNGGLMVRQAQRIMDYVTNMKTAGMVKAGRELAGWSQAELAERADLSVPTIQRMENPQFGPLRSSGANLEKLRLAFEGAGVTFTTADGKDCVCIDQRARSGAREG